MTVVKSIDDHKDFKMVNKGLRVLGFDNGEIGVSAVSVKALVKGLL